MTVKESVDLMVGEVAAEIHAAPRLVEKLAKQNRIPSRKIGRYRVYRREDLPAIRDVAAAAGILYPASSIREMELAGA